MIHSCPQDSVEIVKLTRSVPASLFYPISNYSPSSYMFSGHSKFLSGALIHHASLPSYCSPCLECHPLISVLINSFIHSEHLLLRVSTCPALCTILKFPTVVRRWMRKQLFYCSRQDPGWM